MNGKVILDMQKMKKGDLYSNFSYKVIWGCTPAKWQNKPKYANTWNSGISGFSLRKEKKNSHYSEWRRLKMRIISCRPTFNDYSWVQSISSDYIARTFHIHTYFSL